jgi:hypothetical protein
MIWHLGGVGSMQIAATRGVALICLQFWELQKITKIEKRRQLFEMFGCGTLRIEKMFFASQNAG